MTAYFYLNKQYAMAYNGVARASASGGTHPGAQSLGAHQHTYCSHSKMRFKQKFSPSMLKNAYLFGKKN